ncbi:39S ribosomal protein L35, mitochondrial [Sitodiplosis mosellana]|uniref:39S ribosomal protein L35, mitochondrial n=1 Tax=Sitodiplosis mosellana TaxID=263140 RepID=UPI00244438F7|nr:39S ribosomal protein L35, mitochondrial [Sitodiplosis mosellana]
MFRFARTVLGRSNALLSQALVPASALQSNIVRNVPGRGFTVLSSIPAKPFCVPNALKYLETTPSTIITPSLESVPIRTVTKRSLKSGKRKTVKAAIRRFKRLDWGGWIRTRCGRHKKMYKKRANRKHRLRQHVLVNKTQALLLDKMVTNFWKRPKYYIDDLYAPYHERTYFYASQKPQPYPEKPLTKRRSVWDMAKGNYY